MRALLPGLIGLFLATFSLPATVRAQAFCEVDYTLPDTLRYCAGDSVTVDIGMLPDTFSIEWSTGSTTSEVTFTAPGTYLLIIRNAAGTCQTDDAVVVIEESFPNIDYQTAGRVCAGDTLRIIDATQLEAGGFLRYELAGTQFDIQPGDTLYYPAFPGLDTSQAYVTAISPLGCTSRDTFDLLSFPRPEIDFRLSPPAFCYSDTVLIIDQTMVAETGSVNYFLSSLELIDMPGDTFAYRPTAFGLDTARIDIRAEQYGCTTEDSLFLIPLPNPEAEISVDPEYCLNEPAVLGVTVGNAPTGFSYVFTSGESGQEPQSGASGTATATISTQYANAGSFDYTLTLELPNGCRTTYPGSLRILDFITPRIQGLAADYCADGSLDTLVLIPAGGMIDGTGIVSGSVTDTSVVIRLDQPGTFPIGYSYTAENGCSDTQNYSYRVNPLPDVDLGPDVALPSGESIVLQPTSVSATYEYRWSTGATTPSLTVSNPGFYVLQASVANTGCMAADTIEVLFANPVFDYGPTTAVRVFPNPTFGVLHLDAAALPSWPRELIRIWNAGGKQVAVYPAIPRPGANPVRLELPPGLPAGAYWLSWGSYRAGFILR